MIGWPTFTHHGIASLFFALCLSAPSGCRNPELFDYDGDGVVDADDCAPQDETIFPGAAEICDDGIDNDCDDDIDLDDGDCQTGDDDDDDVVPDDNDGDGYTIDEGDCDDDNPDINPGVDELLCDGDDNDCNEETPDDKDEDGDGYTYCGEDEPDCNDTDASVHPGAEEVCLNGIDDNCDGSANGCTFSGEYSLAAAPGRLLGENDYDTAGYAIAGAGDLDGDGCDEVLVGAPAESLSGQFVGATYVVRGPVNGDLDLSIADAKLTGEINSFSGRSVAGNGDVNGDGFLDILVGAANTNDYTGAVYLVTSPLVGGPLVDVAAAVVVGGAQGDEAGKAVAIVGDVNGDGLDDVLIGVEDTNPPFGTAYLFYGPIAGQMSLGDADVQITGEEDHGSVGASVAPAGDVNQDGYADWLVSMPYAQGGGILLYHGGTDILPTMGLADAAGLLHEGGGSFGYGMGAGDVDKDGIPDIAGVGELSYQEVPYGVVHLHSGPLQGTVDLTVPNQVDGVVVPEQFDRRLWTATLDGDVDGDGGADLLVGEYCPDPGSVGPGTAYLFLQDFSEEIGLSDATATFVGEEVGDCAGTSLAIAGDVAGDGLDDLMIGAQNGNAGAFHGGVVYLYASGDWL